MNANKSKEKLVSIVMDSIFLRFINLNDLLCNWKFIQWRTGVARSVTGNELTVLLAMQHRSQPLGPAFI